MASRKILDELGQIARQVQREFKEERRAALLPASIWSCSLRSRCATRATARATCATCSTSTAATGVQRPWGDADAFSAVRSAASSADADAQSRCAGRPGSGSSRALPHPRATSRAKAGRTGSCCCTAPTARPRARRRRASCARSSTTRCATRGRSTASIGFFPVRARCAARSVSAEGAEAGAAVRGRSYAHLPDDRSTRGSSSRSATTRYF